MMYEIKETSEIETTKDVENRIYHAFSVFRHLPDIEPKGYFNLWVNIMEGAAEPMPMPEPKKDIFIPHDIELAEEVCDVWWKILLKYTSIETRELIKYRCGAPIIKDGKLRYKWTGVRTWYDVAQEFYIHQNTAHNWWNSAMKLLLEKLDK